MDTVGCCCSLGHCVCVTPNSLGDWIQRTVCGHSIDAMGNLPTRVLTLGM